MIPENMTVKDFELCCEMIEEHSMIGWVLDGSISSAGYASHCTN